MNWVIVEIIERHPRIEVNVVGPFEEERAAEMIRRNRHFDRFMNGGPCVADRSYVRKVEEP